MRLNFFIFMGYFRKMWQNQQSETHTFVHMNSISRNPGSASEIQHIFTIDYNFIINYNLFEKHDDAHSVWQRDLTTSNNHSLIVFFATEKLNISQ